MKTSPNPLFIDPNDGTKHEANDEFKPQQSTNAHANESDLENGYNGIAPTFAMLGHEGPPIAQRKPLSNRMIMLLLVAVVAGAACIFFIFDTAFPDDEEPNDGGEFVRLERSPSPAPGPAPSPVDPANPLFRLSFTTEVDSTIKLSFERAVAFWNNVVSNDLEPAGRVQINGQCTGFSPPASFAGLLVAITIEEIDGESGILGSAGPCAYQMINNRWRPRVGMMRFDSADVAVLQAKGQMDAVVIHELAHVLGFGTLWEQNELLQVDDSSRANHRYVGKHGNEGYRDLDGYVEGNSPYVPVENTGGAGTAKGHWRNSAFNTELMTGYLSKNEDNPLSIMTIRALRDLGYTVDESKAEVYTIPSARDDLASRDPGTFIDFGDDMMIPDESDFSKTFD